MIVNTTEHTCCAGSRTPETDSVLTSLEMQQLLDQEGIDLRNVPEGELDSVVGGHSDSLTGLPGGSGEQYCPLVCLENLAQS